ncbi:hypothetical protein SteCoe_26070 [Stentor coeruleus]|uniref:Uncharacterized protein n=1 Tax=Stentor coeruleus TaxID=5963 RepID=A0A1R2BDR3_9CILI|nr:hypothetical protein SteCoe_26070 [Stentor coeruleus]
MQREEQNLDRIRAKSSRIAPIPQKNDMLDDCTCRICMEPESKGNILIAPCKCSGTVKYIHEECLKTWIISQEGDIDEGQCELCKTQFLMEFKIGKKCSPKESVKNGWSPFLYLPVLFAVMVMLFLVIYLLAERYISISQGNNEKGYTIALMITCGISGLVLLLLIVNTLKEICLVAKLEEWHIFSQNFDQESEESIPVDKDETMIHERSFCPVLIIPENLIIKGVKVKTPELRPNMVALNQRGRVVGYASRGISPTPENSASISIPMRLNTDPI